MVIFCRCCQSEQDFLVFFRRGSIIYKARCLRCLTWARPIDVMTTSVRMP